MLKGRCTLSCATSSRGNAFDVEHMKIRLHIERPSLRVRSDKPPASPAQDTLDEYVEKPIGPQQELESTTEDTSRGTESSGSSEVRPSQSQIQAPGSDTLIYGRQYI